MIPSYPRPYTNGPRHLRAGDDTPPSLLTPYQSGGGTAEDEEEMAFLQRYEQTQMQREAGVPPAPRKVEASYDETEDYKPMAELQQAEEDEAEARPDSWKSSFDREPGIKMPAPSGHSSPHEQGRDEEGEALATDGKSRLSRLAMAQEGRQGPSEGEGLEEQRTSGLVAENHARQPGAPSYGGPASPHAGSVRHLNSPAENGNRGNFESIAASSPTTASGDKSAATGPGTRKLAADEAKNLDLETKRRMALGNQPGRRPPSSAQKTSGSPDAEAKAGGRKPPRKETGDKPAVARGQPPKWEPDKWPKDSIKEDSEGVTQEVNCFNYACNHPTGPGVPDGVERTDFTEESLLQALADPNKNGWKWPEDKQDGARPSCKKGYHLVAIFTSPKDSDSPLDYHFYREDVGGTWSHYQIDNGVSQKDATGKKLEKGKNEPWDDLEEDGSSKKHTYGKYKYIYTGLMCAPD